MNSYQFNRIASYMAKDYGTFVTDRERESQYIPMMKIEVEMLELYREDPKLYCSKRVKEAYLILLHKIQAFVKNQDVDLSAFENEANKKMVEVLWSFIDPTSHGSIEPLWGRAELNTEQERKKYFINAVKVFVQLLKSVDSNNDRFGSDGYFQFLNITLANLNRDNISSFYK